MHTQPSAVSTGSCCGDAPADGYDIGSSLCYYNDSRTHQTTGTGNGTAPLHGAAGRPLWAPPYYCDFASRADDRRIGHCLVVDPFDGADANGECKDGGDDASLSDSSDSDTEECHNSTDDSDDEDDQEISNNDNDQCGVAPPHTTYAHGYTFIEGFMPADWFNALVRPERRLVLLVCGVPVAVDAAEVERAARVDRLLVTPVGSCRLGPTDAERAHEVDESLYGREGIRRALAPVPLAATLEAVGAPAAEAAGGVGGAVLAGILGALL